jgi:hypothetical protein
MDLFLFHDKQKTPQILSKTVTNYPIFLQQTKRAKLMRRFAPKTYKRLSSESN